MAVTESSTRESPIKKPSADSAAAAAGEAKERAERLMRIPAIAHLLRTNQRFTIRLGNQFGAAITYFSVLSMVPIIMFAFAAAGFVLLVAAPQLMDQLMAEINNAMAGMQQAQRDKLLTVIEDSLRGWKTIGLVGLASAMYSGAGWAGNLKEAVRAMWRQDFDLRVKKENIVVKILKNFAILIGLLVMMVVSFAVASVSTALTDQIIGWLGLDDFGWLRPVLRYTPVLISIGAGWLIFMYIYTVMPETRVSWKTVRRGALIGAVGLALLQYLMTFLMGLFAGNPAAALFGPIISLMLFFNLFARLILFVAAWVGTAEAPVTAAHARQSRSRRRRGAGDAASEDDGDERERDDDAAADSAGPARTTNGDEPDDDPRGHWSRTPGYVAHDTAERSVRAGMGAGYVAGAATGAGVGAALTYLISKITGR